MANIINNKIFDIVIMIIIIVTLILLLLVHIFNTSEESYKDYNYSTCPINESK